MAITVQFVYLTPNQQLSLLPITNKEREKKTMEQTQLKLEHETDHGFVTITLIDKPSFMVKTHSVRYIKNPLTPRRKAEVIVTEYHSNLSSAKRAYNREILRQRARGFTRPYTEEIGLLAPHISAVRDSINAAADRSTDGTEY